MTQIRPFRPDDLARLRDELDLQTYQVVAIADPLALIEAAAGEIWTVVDEADGEERVRAISGLVYYTSSRAQAWTLIGRDFTRREWAIAARKMGARLTLLQEFHGLRRVEAETPLEYGAGHRLLVHLGFSFEACMPGFGPAGETWCRYARLAERARLPVRYDKLRALGYRTLIEDVIDPPRVGRAA